MNQLFQKLKSTRKRNLSASSLLVKCNKWAPSSKGATKFREIIPGDTCQLFLLSGCRSLVLTSPSRKTKSLRTSIKANLENSVSPSVQAWKPLCSVTDFKFHDIKLLNSKLQEEALIRHLHTINAQKRHFSVCLFRAAPPKFLLLLVLLAAVVLFILNQWLNLSVPLSLSAENNQCITWSLILACLPSFLFLFSFTHLCSFRRKVWLGSIPQQPIIANIRAFTTTTPFPSPTPLHS